MKPRLSPRPSKALLWRYVADFASTAPVFYTTLDVACGEMTMRPFFRSKRYIGIDIDAERISIGKRKFPDAEGYVEDIFSLSRQADCVVCLQTIGINNLFNARDSITAIERLVNATNSEGTLVFNIGPLVFESYPIIEKIIHDNFNRFEVKKYGRFSGQTTVSISNTLSKLMYHIPVLAQSKKTPYALFICKDKLAGAD